MSLTIPHRPGALDCLLQHSNTIKMRFVNNLLFLSRLYEYMYYLIASHAHSCNPCIGIGCFGKPFIYLYELCTTKAISHHQQKIDELVQNTKTSSRKKCCHLASAAVLSALLIVFRSSYNNFLCRYIHYSYTLTTANIFMCCLVFNLSTSIPCVHSLYLPFSSLLRKYVEAGERKKR